MKDLESRESSSPVVTRAVAAALMGKYCEIYEFPFYQRLGLGCLSLFPPSAAMRVIPPMQTLSAYEGKRVRNLRTQDLVQARIKDYEELRGKWPAITMGVAMGGATAHLSAALRSPFLPQAFVLTLKGGSPDGNAHFYFSRSHAIALDIADQNPDLMTIQHYDPIHDGWLTRYVNHLRLKLTKLPEAYKEFIHQRLEPGGSIIYLEGGAKWLRYRVGLNSVFQVGGWGDISASEYIESSPRIKNYCKKIGLRYENWAIDRYPLEEGPESEWGTEPGLAEELEAFCDSEGYTLIRIQFDTPFDFSILAYYVYLNLLEKSGKVPQGILVETFSQFDALAPLEAGLVPLWLVFNTTDNLRFLNKMMPDFPTGVPIFFSVLSTFSETPDLVRYQDWEKTLAGKNWTNIGAQGKRYPADTKALLGWNIPLRKWCAQHPYPIQDRITGDELAEIARKIDIIKDGRKSSQGA